MKAQSSYCGGTPTHDRLELSRRVTKGEVKLVSEIEVQGKAKQDEKGKDVNDIQR